MSGLNKYVLVLTLLTWLVIFSWFFHEPALNFITVTIWVVYFMSMLYWSNSEIKPPKSLQRLHKGENIG